MASSRIHASRHVVFDETRFPFLTKSLSSQSVSSSNSSLTLLDSGILSILPPSSRNLIILHLIFLLPLLSLLILFHLIHLPFLLYHNPLFQPLPLILFHFQTELLLLVAKMVFLNPKKYLALLSKLLLSNPPLSKKQYYILTGKLL